MKRWRDRGVIEGKGESKWNRIGVHKRSGRERKRCGRERRAEKVRVQKELPGGGRKEKEKMRKKQRRSAVSGTEIVTLDPRKPVKRENCFGIISTTETAQASHESSTSGLSKRN